MEHLGQKLILHISIGSFSISVDFITIVMSWLVMAILIGLAFLFRRGLRRPVEDKPGACRRYLR